jgi:zinc transport system substrate-binding protein
MKKNISFILIFISIFVCLTGCGTDISSINDIINNKDKLNIVCTTFPQYDWVSNIIKGNEENVSLTLLMDKGGDLHNFQPSALDIAKVSGCDIFIYVGGESDTWVNDALKEAANPDLTAINMVESLEGYVTLYEDNHEHEDEDGHDLEEESEHEYEYDEHVWLSLRNATVLSDYICEVLSQNDNEHESLYRENCDKYKKELAELDEEYKNVVKQGSHDTLLFADRFPFRYMVEDYGLNYLAAFEGCSAETEASFNIVATLSDSLSALGLNAVCVIDGSDKRLAKVIIENSDNEDRQIIMLDSMQSVSKKDIENGTTYISTMRDNLETLKFALE